MKLAVVFCLWIVLVATPPTTLAQASACRIEPFQGATLPQGTVARMRVVNTGAACVIENWGVPADRAYPAESGSITQAAAHGKAEFLAPQARYTPVPGYVGEDTFEYEAFARGRVNQQVRLKVQVKVLVVAP